MADFNHGHALVRPRIYEDWAHLLAMRFGSQGFCFVLVFSGLVSMLHKFLDDIFLLRIKY